MINLAYILQLLYDTYIILLILYSYLCTYDIIYFCDIICTFWKREQTLVIADYRKKNYNFQVTLFFLSVF